jgi:predicted metal-dependent HD superfamily phosphohydrolase
MQKLFESICQKFGNQEKCEAAFAKLVARYLVPERFYHTFLGHISACLRELEVVPIGLFRDKYALAIALFFHDVVMDFSRSDNEERSAEFSVQLCREMGMPLRFRREVARLILDTKHNAAPEGIDSQLIIDIDLSILGQTVEIFDDYEKNIRREYAFVPENIFVSRRAEILKCFLDRPSIFWTEYFQGKYEEQARRNLTRSIAKLDL